MRSVTPGSAPAAARGQNDTLPGEVGYKLAVDVAAEMKDRPAQEQTPPPDVAPASLPAGATDEPEPLDALAEAEPQCPIEAEAPADSDTNGHEPSAEPAAGNPEISMWQRALASGRPAIRRHAAKQLERLTGHRYEV
jgi:hypothetical protein